MNTLSHKGKTYEKASLLAKKFRYTADYVGQLCRAGKIDAKLVGRTWFADPESLLKHKRDRYKTDTAASQTTGKRTQTQISETIMRRPAAVANIRMPSSAVYQVDEADLWPSFPTQKETSVMTNKTKQPVAAAPKAAAIKIKRTFAEPTASSSHLTATTATVPIKCRIDNNKNWQRLTASNQLYDLTVPAADKNQSSGSKKQPTKYHSEPVSWLVIGVFSLCLVLASLLLEQKIVVTDSLDAVHYSFSTDSLAQLQNRAVTQAQIIMSR